MQTSKIKWIILVIGTFLLWTCPPGCIDAKSKFQTDVQAKLGVVNDKLEKVVEQVAHFDPRVTAERIDKLQQTLNQQTIGTLETFGKRIMAGTINYGGAGWVVIAAISIIAVFLLIPLIGLWWLTRKTSRLRELLHLVTGAVARTPPTVSRSVKDEIERVISDGTNPFSPKHKLELTRFAKNMGTFADTSGEKME